MAVVPDSQVNVHVHLQLVLVIELSSADRAIVLLSTAMDDGAVSLHILIAQRLAAVRALLRFHRGVLSSLVQFEVDKKETANVAGLDRFRDCVLLDVALQGQGRLESLATDVANVTGNILVLEVDVVLQLFMCHEHWNGEGIY